MQFFIKLYSFQFFSNNFVQRELIPLISVPFHRQVPPASSLLRQYLAKFSPSHRKPSHATSRRKTFDKSPIKTKYPPTRPQSSSRQSVFHTFWSVGGTLELVGNISKKCPTNFIHQLSQLFLSFWERNLKTSRKKRKSDIIQIHTGISNSSLL